jgi:hypothetical protein
VLPDEETLYNQTMPQMSEQELFGILDAIKTIAGDYRGRGDSMELEAKKSKWGDFQARDEDGYLVYNEGETKPYDVKLSEQDVVGILQALSAMPAYRPIETSPDPMDFMDFEFQAAKRYPQLFGRD